MAKKEIKKEEVNIAPNPRKVKAISKHIRIAPRKMRLVIDMIRKRQAMEAVGILTLLPRKGARIALKVLESAIANAENLGLNVQRLVVADTWADGGPVMKRFLTRSMGRADRILKRTTHLTMVVMEGNKLWSGKMPEAAKSEKKKAAKAA